MTKKPVNPNLPKTYSDTLEEIKSVDKQIYQLEMIEYQKSDKKLWDYKRRLIAHLYNF